MQGNLLSISGGPTLRSLRRLKRKSHFLLNKPSVSIRYNHIYFSASSFEKMDINKYKNVGFSIEEGVEIEEALRLYIVPNNEEESDINCPININKSRSQFSVASTTTIVNQIPRLRMLLVKKRHERRIFLQFDDVLKLWYIPLVPQFEYRSKDFKNLVDAKGIYRLIFKGDIQYIGETNNIARRVHEHLKHQEIKFDEVQYSILSNVKDDERKSWETFHLEKYVKETGLLPPHNRLKGKSN